MDLEDKLSGVGETQKDTVCMVPLTGGVGSSQLHTERSRRVSRAGRGRERELLFNGTQLLFGMMKNSGDGGGDGCTLF